MNAISSSLDMFGRVSNKDMRQRVLLEGLVCVVQCFLDLSRVLSPVDRGDDAKGQLAIGLIHFARHGIKKLVDVDLHSLPGFKGVD